MVFGSLGARGAAQENVPIGEGRGGSILIIFIILVLVLILIVVVILMEELLDNGVAEPKEVISSPRSWRWWSPITISYGLEEPPMTRIRCGSHQHHLGLLLDQDLASGPGHHATRVAAPSTHTCAPEAQGQRPATASHHIDPQLMDGQRAQRQRQPRPAAPPRPHDGQWGPRGGGVGWPQGGHVPPWGGGSGVGARWPQRVSLVMAWAWWLQPISWSGGGWS